MTPIPRRARRPLSPPAAALTQAASGGLSRRALLGTGLAAGAGLALTGCAPPRAARGWRLASLDLPTDVSDTEKILKWANWTAYLDMNGKETKSPTLEAFMQKTGIEVTYSEDIDDNDSYYAKVAPAAARRPEHRPRHLHPHRLDGGARDPRPALPAAAS